MPRVRLTIPALLAVALVPVARPDGADPFRTLFAHLDANRIAANASNVGLFGTTDATFSDALEFPRGSGKLNFFPMGLWIGANVNGERQGAFREYYGEFRPGPMIAGTYSLFDTTYKVYKVAHGDTTGWAEWMANAVPLGAPTDAAGTAPGVLGSQTLWTVYNDADPVLHQNRLGGSVPLGVEVRQTIWAFKEHGARDNVALFRWRIENRGANTLDSVYVGVWTDSDLGGGHSSFFGADPALAMVYSYPDTQFAFIYGDSTPAMGIRLLEGARVTPGGPDLGATSMASYFHGPEPQSPFEFGNVLRGLEVSGAPMIDPTTGLPSLYRYTGDPFLGTGWLDTLHADMRTMIATGPFTMAPGDTQQITAALVFGWGPSWQYALDSLYVNAQTDFFAPLGEEYEDPDTIPPPPEPAPSYTLDAWPNPTQGSVRWSFFPPSGARYRLDLYDLRGRRLGTLDQGVGGGQPISFVWVPSDAPIPLFGQFRSSAWPRSGMYFAVLDIDGRRTTKRIVIFDR